MKTRGFFMTIFVVSCWSAALMAQTSVSGPISANTTWTIAGSPYVVTGNTLVQEGINLTIEAGVTIKFEDQTALQVDGELIAIGTTGNKITFTSAEPEPAPDDWGFIAFSNTSIDAEFDVNGNYISGSILEHCIVEFAGGGDYTFAAVMMDNALPYVHSCTIQNNGSSGIYANNIPGTLRIIHNVIMDNTGDTGGGINVWGGHVIITGNTITGNSALTSYGGGGIFAFSNTSEIFNNLISGNTAIGYGAGGGGGGIYIREASADISKNIIRDNSLTNLEGGEGGGILIYLSAATIYGNEITNNSGGFGGGIFGGNLISNNCISENYAGIKGGAVYMSQNSISNNSMVNNTADNGSVIDIYLAEDPLEFNYNTASGNITTGENPTYSMGISAHPLINFNNFFGNTSNYELYNYNGSLTAHLNAKENWWGTTSGQDIQDLIFDWIDDASRGIVDYAPFATGIRTDAPVSPPSGLMMTESSGQIALNWNGNPEPDLAGYKVHWGTSNDYPYEHTIDVGNVTSYTITGLSSGAYFATVTAYDNAAGTVTDDPGTIVNEIQCAGNESWYSKPVSNVGINDALAGNESAVSVFPNPTAGSFSLSFPAGTSEIQIFNSLGYPVQKKDVHHQTRSEFLIHQNGTFFIQVITDQQIITKKIIVSN